MVAKNYVTLHSQSSFYFVKCCFKDYFGDNIETIKIPLISDLLPALFLRQAENLQLYKLCLDVQIQTTFVIHKSCISRSGPVSQCFLLNNIHSLVLREEQGKHI